MRTPIIAGNWKMNTTLADGPTLANEIRTGLNHLQGIEKIVCPPFTTLFVISAALEGTSIKVGAQNMHYEAKGAFTGEISSTMLRDMCEYVILGHSERRQYFGEDDGLINKKVVAALKANLKPIFAVGERLDDRDAGKTEEVITRQIRAGLKDVAAPESLIVAYEPVWAIGTGRAATAAGANETVAFIRHLLAGLYDAAFASQTRILYGGSVTPANIADFMAQPDIDGGLVGGASLKSADFIALTRTAAQVAATRR